MSTGPIKTTAQAILKDIDRRLKTQERRGTPRLLDTGPGMSSRAVQILDWNSEVTTFNGFFWSIPGALHSPDPDIPWTGQSIAKDNGAGLQQVWNVDPATGITTRFRSWVTNTTTGAIEYGDWTKFATASGMIGEAELDQPVLDNIQDALNNAASAVTFAEASNRTFRQPTAPTNPDGDYALRVNDTWFDTDDQDRPYVWTGAAWVLLEQAAAEAAQIAADAAHAEALAAAADAANAITAASNAQSTANTALSDAATAITNAGTAQTNIDNEVTNRVNALNAEINNRTAGDTANTNAINNAITDYNAKIALKSKHTLSSSAPTTADAGNAGDVWERYETASGNNRIIGRWRLMNSASPYTWQAMNLDATYIPQLDIGTGTFGDLSGARIAANSIKAAQIDVNDLNAQGSIIVGQSQVTGLGTALAGKDDAGAAAAARTNAVNDLKTLWGLPSNTTLINGGTIATQTILAKSLALADWTNLCTDPRMAVDAAWTNGGTNGGTGWAKVTGVAPTPLGTTVARRSPVADGTGPDDYTANGLNYSIPVEPGDQFHMEAYVRRNGTAPTAGSIQSGCWLADPAGTFVANFTWTQAASAVSSTAWTLATIDFTVPAGAAARMWIIPLYVWSSVNNGTYDVTDVTVRRKNGGELIVDGAITSSKISTGAITAEKLTVGSLGADLVADGGFEDGGTWTLANGGTIVAAAARSGSKGLRLGANAAVQATSRAFPVAPGDAISITAWAKGTTTPTGLYLRLSWRNAAGAEIGISDSIQAWNVPAAWTQHAGVFGTPPAGAVNAIFQVYNTGGAVDVDDVSLRKVVVSAQIADGAITSPKITGDAIDGKTITGAILQTSSAANTGVKFTNAGLTAYDGGGAAVFTLLASTGAMTVTGPVLTGGTITGPTFKTTSAASRGVQVDTTGLYAWDGSGVLKFSVSASTGIMTATGASFSGNIDSSIVTGGTIQTTGATARGIKLSSSGLIGYDSVGNPTFVLDPNTGTVTMKGTLTAGSSIRGQDIIAGSIATDRITIGLSGNLLDNGDAGETPSRQTTYPRASWWEYWSDSATGYGHSHSGTKMFLINTTSNPGWPYGQFAGQIPVNPGDVYTLSYWSKRWNNCNTPVAVQFLGYKGDGTYTGNPDIGSLQTATSDPNATWVFRTQQFTVPADTYYLTPTLGIRSGTAGNEVWFIDDISLTKAVPYVNTLAVSGVGIVIRNNGSSGVIEGYSGVAGETPGTITPASYAGTPTLTLSPGSASGLNVPTIRMQSMAPGSPNYGSHVDILANQATFQDPGGSGGLYMNYLGASKISLEHIALVQLSVGGTTLSVNGSVCRATGGFQSASSITANSDGSGQGFIDQTYVGQTATTASINTSGRIVRTSTIKMKHSLKEMTEQEAKSVLGLVSYTGKFRKSEHDFFEDPVTYPFFVAEQAAKAGAELWVSRQHKVERDEDGIPTKFIRCPDGEPVAFRTADVTVAHNWLIKDLYAEIDALKTELANLK